MSRLSNSRRRERGGLVILTRIRRLITTLAGAALLAGMAACSGPVSSPGPSHAATSSPSASAPSASPTAATRTVFAVLEARHCQAPEPAACESPANSRHDTAAIAGLDGFAVAKTTFGPRAIPVLGNVATIVQLEGQVAAGALYYADGKGVVRRLDASGSVKTVATFALGSSQQELSFAVSPDGTHLMAAVLTVPDHQPSTDPSAPFGHFSGPYRLEIQAAVAGGGTSVIRKWESTTTQYPDSPGGFTNIVLVGWDGQGPIALIHAPTGTQNAWLDNQRWFAGSLARVHADGTVGTPIGPADCLPYWRPLAGRFVCTRTPTGSQTATPVSVIGVDGTTVWTGVAPAAGAGQIAGGFALSPDGTRLAMDGQVVTLAGGAAVVNLPANFTPEGWLTSDTIIGLIPGPHTAGTLGVLRLSDPKHPEDWGFSGTFTGTLQASAAGQPAL